METKFFLDLQKFSDDTGSEETPGAEQSNDLNIDNLTEEQVAEIKSKLNLKSDEEVDTIIKSKKSRWQKELEHEKNEAAKLAKLSEADRQKALFDKEKSKFDEEREAFRQEQLFVEKGKQLIAQGMPAEFANRIQGNEAEEILEDVKTLRAEWDKAIEEEVNRRLVQKTQKVGTGSVGSLTKKEIMSIKDDTERTQAIAANRHLF